MVVARISCSCLCEQRLLRVRTAIFDLEWNPRIIRLFRLVDRDFFVGAAPTHPHQRFVDGNTYKPRVKARITPEFRQVLERFYERVLHNVLGILVVASDVLGQAKHFSLVAFDQLLKRALGSTLRTGDNALLIPFRESIGGWHW